MAVLGGWSVSYERGTPVGGAGVAGGGVEGRVEALNPQPSTLNPQPSILNPQPSTLNPQLSTLNPQGVEERVEAFLRAAHDGDLSSF